MRQAIAEAKKAFEKDEVPVGAIIVYNSRVIAKAHIVLMRTEFSYHELYNENSNRFICAQHDSNVQPPVS